MHTFNVSLGDAAGEWLEARAASAGSNPAAFAAQIIEDAYKHSLLSWEEVALLRAIRALMLSERCAPQLEQVFARWKALSPALSGEAFGDAVDSLTKRDLLSAEPTDGVALRLTPSGSRVAQSI